MSTIQIRIDEKTKKSAKYILDELGIDISTAIKVYFKQIIIQKKIPLILTTENHLTPYQEQEILDASEEAKKGKNITKPMSIKEAIGYLNTLK